MSLTLTGRITNKELILLEEVARLVFVLVCSSDNGETSGISCHSAGETARQLDRTLSEGCLARVTFASAKATTPQFGSSRRVTSAVLLGLAPTPDDATPEQRTPSAWGLWRQDRGWFRNLNSSGGNSFDRRKAVVFVAENNHAKRFSRFQECKDQQGLLSMAFGCRTIIKAIF